VIFTTDVCFVGGKLQYGYTWMRAAVKAHQDVDHAKTGPREELKFYLSTPLEQVDDIVSLWGIRSCFMSSFISLRIKFHI
jgi:hypothetical protein